MHRAGAVAAALTLLLGAQMLALLADLLDQAALWLGRWVLELAGPEPEVQRAQA